MGEFINLTINELMDHVDKLGTEGGGCLEVSGTLKGGPRSIWIDQTEWHDTPVCLIGGNGLDVSAISTDEVSTELAFHLGKYFDGDSFSISV